MKTESELMKRNCKTKRMRSGLIQLLIVLGVIILGIVITVVLVKLKKPPKQEKPEILAPLVKVEQLSRKDIQMVVRGYGTVSPRVQVEIVPQVSGKVVWVNPQFKPGGFIRSGEKIIKIDPRDYELSVRQADASVAEAQVQLDLEKAEGQVAREEWRQLHPNKEPVSPLVFREPQVRQAEARLESAKAGLAVAELNLERTQLSLPVDALIMSEKVDLGQFVVSGQAVGAAYGIESVEIEVPLEDRELAWLNIPDNTVSLNGNTPLPKGSDVKVKAKFAGAEHIWQGHVVRTTGQIDQTSRLISVVVEVPQPFERADSRPPLMPGMFVEVLIEGNTLKNAVAIPRDAIRESNEVWVVKDGRLNILDLHIVRADRDFAYAISGLDDGNMIVLSSLDTVVEGMRVRTQTGLSTTFAETEKNQDEIRAQGVKTN
jgi:RND family efflux transporter MFP subunit